MGIGNLVDSLEEWQAHRAGIFIGRGLDDQVRFTKYHQVLINIGLEDHSSGLRLKLYLRLDGVDEGPSFFCSIHIAGHAAFLLLKHPEKDHHALIQMLRESLGDGRGIEGLIRQAVNELAILHIEQALESNIFGHFHLKFTKIPILRDQAVNVNGGRLLLGSFLFLLCFGEFLAGLVVKSLLGFAPFLLRWRLFLINGLGLLQLMVVVLLLCLRVYGGWLGSHGNLLGVELMQQPLCIWLLLRRQKHLLIALRLSPIH